MRQLGRSPYVCGARCRAMLPIACRLPCGAPDCSSRSWSPQQFPTRSSVWVRVPGSVVAGDRSTADDRRRAVGRRRRDLQAQPARLSARRRPPAPAAATHRQRGHAAAATAVRPFQLRRTADRARRAGSATPFRPRSPRARPRPSSTSPRPRSSTTQSACRPPLTTARRGWQASDRSSRHSVFLFSWGRWLVSRR